MKPTAIFLSFGLMIFAAGCSDSPPPAVAPAPAISSDSASVSEPASAAPAIDGHELDRAIQDPLDRARAVEGEMKKAAEEADKKLQDQGG